MDNSNGVEKTAAGPQISPTSPTPQIDGTEDKQEVDFTFQSEYGEEDILNSLIQTISLALMQSKFCRLFLHGGAEPCSS